MLQSCVTVTSHITAMWPGTGWGWRLPFVTGGSSRESECLVAIHLGDLARLLGAGASRAARLLQTLDVVHEGTDTSLGGLASIEVSNNSDRHLVHLPLVFRHLHYSPAYTLHLLHLKPTMPPSHLTAHQIDSSGTNLIIN